VARVLADERRGPHCGARPYEESRTIRRARTGTRSRRSTGWPSVIGNATCARWPTPSACAPTRGRGRGDGGAGPRSATPDLCRQGPPRSLFRR
jgi:hypothetical protein